MPEPLQVLTSQCVVLSQANIDTDQIIPARFLTTTSREGLGKAVFHDWRYEADGSPKPEAVLIRALEIDEGHAVVTMTLTTPHCPVAESMPAEVELRVGSVPGVGHAEVNLVWDPPWDPQKMSDDAKLELGML